MFRSVGIYLVPSPRKEEVTEWVSNVWGIRLCLQIGGAHSLSRFRCRSYCYTLGLGTR